MACTCFLVTRTCSLLQQSQLFPAHLQFLQLHANHCVQSLKFPLPDYTYFAHFCLLQSLGLQQSDRGEQRLPVWPDLPSAVIPQ